MNKLNSEDNPVIMIVKLSTRIIIDYQAQY